MLPEDGIHALLYSTVRMIVWNNNFRSSVGVWLTFLLGVGIGAMAIATGIRYYHACDNSTGGWLMMTGAFLANGSLHFFARATATCEPLVEHLRKPKRTVYHLHLIDIMMPLLLTILAIFGVVFWNQKSDSDDCKQSIMVVALTSILSLAVGVGSVLWMIMNRPRPELMDDTEEPLIEDRARKSKSRERKSRNRADDI